MKQRLFVANWKMQLSHTQAKDLAQAFVSTVGADNNVIICPSFESLQAVGTIIKTKFKLGAQNVANYPQGAYTGQVSAQSLKEVGCSYCIIGHSEARQYLHENNHDIAQKYRMLTQQKIMPIVCIGESQKDFENKETYTVLEEQLTPVLEQAAHSDTEIIVAYEPLWSIGTGVVPDHDYLGDVHEWIKKQCSPKSSTLLYGGSVHEGNAAKLLNIMHIDGLLIGGASLDAEQFNAIVRADN